MKNIEDINKAAIQKITANKKITDFSPGDTINVGGISCLIFGCIYCAF